MKVKTAHNTKFWTLMSLTLWLVSLTASAQIYKSVDENGVVTFSDVPPAANGDTKSSLVTPNPTNSMPAVTARVPEAEPKLSEPAVPYALSISSPSNNATIPMGAGVFDVKADLSPPLSDGEAMALYLDGQLVEPPQTDTVWTLTYVPRGEHTLQARRLSSSGETVSESELISVFVLRPSVLKRAPK